jgi:Tol biopolymer transport system component
MAGEPADYSNPAISPDQKKIAVGKRDPITKTRDIWVIDSLRNASSRFTFDPGEDLNPSWSPDGTRIAFTSNRKGYRDIYVKPANGAGEEQMLLQIRRKQERRRLVVRRAVSVVGFRYRRMVVLV